VVEEAFAPLVRLHPRSRGDPSGREELAPCAMAGSTWQDIGRFVRRLRSRRYHAVIDTQGLFLKSALLARAARAAATATIQQHQGAVRLRVL